MNRTALLSFTIVVAVATAGCSSTAKPTSGRARTPVPTAVPATSAAPSPASSAVTPSARSNPTPASQPATGTSGDLAGAVIFVRVTGPDGQPAIDAFSAATGSLLAQTPMGIATPDWSAVYVAGPAGQSTTVRALDPRNGSERSRTTVDGSWVVPAALAAAPSDAYARDAGLIVLADTAPPAGRSRFAILPTSFAAPPRVVTLNGAFAFDAIAPNGAYIYFIERVGAQAEGHYQVRAYDSSTQQLLPDPIVDKREIGELMEGAPITRATSANGQWAYTVYVKADGTTFVHELDTLHAIAFCGDLPGDLRASSADDRAAWRIGIAGNDMPYVANGRLGVVGVVRNEAVDPVAKLAVDALAGDSDLVVAVDGRTLYLAGPAGLTTVNQATLEADGPFAKLSGAASGGAVLSPDGTSIVAGAFGPTGSAVQWFAIGQDQPYLTGEIALANVAGLAGARLLGAWQPQP